MDLPTKVLLSKIEMRISEVYAIEFIPSTCDRSRIRKYTRRRISYKFFQLNLRENSLYMKYYLSEISVDLVLNSFMYQKQIIYQTKLGPGI